MSQKQKKGMGVSMTVIAALILVLISFFVILLVTNKGINLLGFLGQKQQCKINIGAMDLFKRLPLAGTQPIQLNCELKKIEITKEQLKNYVGSTSFDDKNLKWPAGYTTEDWMRDKAIADVLMYSWDIVGQGSQNYFGEWWEFFRCKGDKTLGDYGPDPLEGSSTVPCDQVPGNNWWKQWTQGGHASTVTMCMILGRIKFSPDITNDKDIDTLPKWMANTPLPDTTMKSKINPDSVMSYFEYIKTGNEGVAEDGELLGNKLRYSTDTAYVVIYAEPKYYATDGLVKNTLGLINPDLATTFDKKKPLNTLLLVPLKDTASYCDYVLGYPG